MIFDVEDDGLLLWGSMLSDCSLPIHVCSSVFELPLLCNFTIHSTLFRIMTESACEAARAKPSMVVRICADIDS